MLGKRFDEALAYALELRREQIGQRTGASAAGGVAATRDVARLLGLARLALDSGADEHEVVAALLHDALEAAPRRGDAEREIAELFGPDVLAIVKACAGPELEGVFAREGRSDGRRELRAEPFRHLRHADASVLLVVAADALYRARSLVSDLRERGRSAVADADETPWLHGGFLAALRDGGAPRRLLVDLAAAIDELRRVAGAA